MTKCGLSPAAAAAPESVTYRRVAHITRVFDSIFRKLVSMLPEFSRMYYIRTTSKERRCLKSCYCLSTQHFNDVLSLAGSSLFVYIRPAGFDYTSMEVSKCPRVSIRLTVFGYTVRESLNVPLCVHSPDSFRWCVEASLYACVSIRPTFFFTRA